VIFVATDDARMLDTLRAALTNRSLAVTPPGVQAPRLLSRNSIRGRSQWRRMGLNPAVHARGKHGYIAAEDQQHSVLNASTAAQLGADALVDTLLLAQSDFLLGSISAVTTYAILLSPRLNAHSFIFDVSTRRLGPIPWSRNPC
jgi:hypothetical protein